MARVTQKGFAAYRDWASANQGRTDVDAAAVAGTIATLEERLGDKRWAHKHDGYKAELARLRAVHRVLTMEG